MNNLQTNDSTIAFFLWAYRTSNVFMFYANLTIVPCGLLLNILSIIVFSRKVFEKGTMGFYFRIIAIMDSIVLINLFVSFFTQSLGIDIVLTSVFACKFFNLFLRVSFQSSSWLNVIVTLDRVVCIKYLNRRFEFIKDKKIISIILFTALVIIIIINIPNLILDLKVYEYNNQTVVFCTSDSVSNYVREFINIFFRTVFPFTIMLIANINLIRALNKSRLKFKRDRSMKREYYFASSLIIMNSMFLINLIPLELSKILYYFFSSQVTIFTGVITIVYFVTTYVSAFNHVLPFFINLRFNKLFYNEVSRSMKEIKCFLRIRKSMISVTHQTNELTLSATNGNRTNASLRVFTIRKSIDSI